MPSARWYSASANDALPEVVAGAQRAQARQRVAKHVEGGAQDGRLELVPGFALRADRVVALPRLEGPRILGIPQDSEGFIATDLSGRIRGLSNVYAVGDITQFPIKQGGIAAEQADAVAEVIAAQAGAAVQLHRFEPVLRGLLLTGGAPLYLRAEPHGGRGDTSTIAEDPLWWPPAKIAGRYLAPFLAGEPSLPLQ